MSSNGWMGRLGQVKHVLRTFGADVDEAGLFIVKGNITTFMGQTGDDADCVVGADAAYMKGGQWCGLVSTLKQTSYGLHVTVI